MKKLLKTDRKYFEAYVGLADLLTGKDLRGSKGCTSGHALNGSPDINRPLTHWQILTGLQIRI